MKIYAMVTDQGTAAAETAICSNCDSPEAREALKAAAHNDVPRTPGGFVECTANEALSCQICGTMTPEAADYQAELCA